MMQRLLVILLLSIFITSCIPKKDLVYFQGESTQKASINKMVNDPYKLQVNDILDIRIKAADEELVALFQRNENQLNLGGQINAESLYFSSYTVNRNGNIRMPYIGELNVLGYTEKDVREKIENSLKDYFKDPNDVFVTVKLAGIRFTVLGEVNNPGTLVLFQNQVNIVEAIANAGDITITGNRKKVIILRKNLNATKKIVIDLTKVDALDSDSFFIQSNDMIYVEPLKQKSWGTGTTGVQTLTTIVSVVSLVASAILISRNL